MEVNGSLEVVAVPESASAFLNGRDFLIQSFCYGVGYTMREIGPRCWANVV